ncbi:MAG: hypothetical protein HXS44_00975 [Theionarchaea archaeon]|nr:hypothetical protein [Theionarchaea archaeon]
MKDCTEELGAFLKDYSDKHSFSFLREEPRAFASRLCEIFSVFFLSYDESTFMDGLKEKALYCLWNNVIDDIIEYSSKGKDNILDCLEVLAGFRSGGTFNKRTETGQIIHDFMMRFHELPSGLNKEISEDLVFLDLMRILNGFDYERIVHENDGIGTFSEYMEFGAITADLRVFLDIDLATYPKKLTLSTIGDLREAYSRFDMAIKISSDIATFEREYFTELSQNAVILYGQKENLMPRNILSAEQTQKEQFLEDVIPSIVNDIEKKGKEYLSESIKYLERVNEIDTRHISKAFKSMFEKYPGQRTFSPAHQKEHDSEGLETGSL